MAKLFVDDNDREQYHDNLKRLAGKLNETNLKPKHEDSFRILKSYGYKFNGRTPNNKAEWYRRGNHEVHIKDDGTWNHNYYGDDTFGTSHTDLESHLKKVHR